MRAKRFWTCNSTISYTVWISNDHHPFNFVFSFLNFFCREASISSIKFVQRIDSFDDTKIAEIHCYYTSTRNAQAHQNMILIFELCNITLKHFQTSDPLLLRNQISTFLFPRGQSDYYTQQHSHSMHFSAAFIRYLSASCTMHVCMPTFSLVGDYMQNDDDEDAWWFWQGVMSSGWKRSQTVPCETEI